jgi:hypothetical protein
LDDEDDQEYIEETADKVVNEAKPLIPERSKGFSSV